MIYGHYDLNQQGQACYRPPVPEFPALEAVWPDIEKASKALIEFDNRLAAFTTHNLVGKLFARLDAVHSSGAEGTTTTFTDLMEYQSELARSANPADAQSVQAVAEAFDKLSDQPVRPISAMLAIHQRLFEKAPDPHLAATAGHLKTIRNSTFDRDQGGFFNYTAPERVPLALQQWETFTEIKGNAPELLRQALSHWMFEHIHPVADGNGRVGRLLVPLLMRAKGETKAACAFLGEAVHANKDLYIDALKDGRRTGDLVPYSRVFLSMVRQTAESNIDRTEKLAALNATWAEDLAPLRRDAAAHKVASLVLTKPILTVNDAQSYLGHEVSWQGTNTAFDKLVELGILRQIGTSARSRLFEAPGVMAIFEPIRLPTL